MGHESLAWHDLFPPYNLASPEESEFALVSLYGQDNYDVDLCRCLEQKDSNTRELLGKCLYFTMTQMNYRHVTLQRPFHHH